MTAKPTRLWRAFTYVELPDAVNVTPCEDCGPDWRVVIENHDGLAFVSEWHSRSCWLWEVGHRDVVQG